MACPAQRTAATPGSGASGRPFPRENRKMPCRRNRPPSSTRRPTKRPPWPRTRCCRSSRPSPRPPASRSRRATSRWRGASSRSFPEVLTEAQRIPDYLAELGELAKTPEANIIKLPNISASMPQLKAAIKELQGQGYKLPDYPDEAEDARGEGDQGALRQGQGQRREPGAARRQLRPPRAAVGEAVRARSTRTRWARGRKDSKTHVAHMSARRLLRQREVRDRRPRRRRREDRVRGRRRQRHGAQGQDRRCTPARSSTPR